MDQTFDDAEAESFGAQAGTASPMETFIRNEVEPQREQLNTFSSAKEHTRLLLDAAKRRKLRPQKIGFTNISTFALARSAAQVAGIYGKVTSLVSHQALRAASSRELTRQCLVLSSIPHLPGKTFHISQGKSAASFMERLGEPVSIRPTSNTIRFTTGANLATTDELAHAWERAAAASTKLPVAKQQVEVETFLPWVPLRVFVVGEEAVSAVARVPLSVIGDGNQTLEQLGSAELQLRKSCTFLQPLKGLSIKNLLDPLGLDPQRVLPQGQLQLLSYASTGQWGPGWSVDVLDQLSAGLVELAVNATWAFPGLGATAVDILTPSLEAGEQALVSGVEPEADLREFRFPAFGASRFPNRAIMDRLATVKQ